MDSTTHRFQPLTTLEALEDALERSQEEPILLFKHSSTCPISARADQRLQGLTEADDPPVYKLVVQDHRDVSDAIEERFGIRHESPQAILLANGAPVFHASHGNVTADAVRSAATPSS
jgi:bacillithiol system protein YtxJ